MAFCNRGFVGACALAEVRAAEDFSTLQQARDAYERDYILKKMDDVKGNVSRAAELLGLERSHLYRKMKALGIGDKTGTRD